jgi:hypothetical protein
MLETFRFINRAGFFHVKRFNARAWISDSSGRLMKLCRTLQRSSVNIAPFREVDEALSKEKLCFWSWRFSSLLILSVTIEYLHQLVFFFIFEQFQPLMLSFSFIYFLKSILLFLPSCIRFFNLEFNLLIWKCTN